MANQTNRITTILTISAEEAEAGAAKYAAALKSVEQAAQRTAAGVEQSETTVQQSARAMRLASNEAERLTRQLDPQYAAMRALEQQQQRLFTASEALARATQGITTGFGTMAPSAEAARERLKLFSLESDRLTDIQSRLAAGVINSEQALALMNRTVSTGAPLASTAVDHYVNAQNAAAASAVNLRGVMGQLGFQVQDIAVQLQMGTNPLMVFAQQGSQIAGAFGPAGAVIGGVIAVAGAAGMAFGALGKEVDFAKESTDAMQRAQHAAGLTMADGVKSADDLAKSYRGLTAEARALEEVAIAAASRQIGAQQDIVRGLVSQNVAQLERLRVQFEASERLRSQGMGQLDPKNIEKFATMRETFAAIDKFRAGGSVDGLVVSLNKLAAMGGETAEPLQKIADSLVENAKQSSDLEKSWERNEAAGRLLAGTATAADKALLNLGNTSTKSGAKVRTFADVLDDLNGKARELERQRTEQAFALINRTIEEGLTPAQQYEQRVESLNAALARARANGWEPTIEQIEAMNRALQESDPEFKRVTPVEDFPADVADDLNSRIEGAFS